MKNAEATCLAGGATILYQLSSKPAMPRELRRRGRKKPKPQDEEWGVKPQEPKPSVSFSEVDPSSRMYTNLPAGPSSQTDLEAPFGYVDADVKAYFRTIDSRLKVWHDGEEGYDYTGGASSLEGVFY